MNMKTFLQALTAVVALSASPLHANFAEDNIDRIAPEETVEIDRHGVCRNVTNEHSTFDFAVHTDTPAEWFDTLNSIIQANDINKATGAPYALIEPCEQGSAQVMGDVRLGRVGGCVPMFGQAYCWGPNASPYSNIIGSANWNGSSVGGRLVHTNMQGGYGDPVYGLHNQNVPGVVTDIATSSFYSCAIVSSGEAYCWGINTEGQLGAGYTSSREKTPVQVTGLTDVVAIDVANTEPAYTACAVKGDGTVWCWGKQDFGRTGNGAAGNAIISTPTQVIGISDAVDVSVGPFHSCALQADKGVSCWGFNLSGAVRPSGYNPFSNSTAVVTPYRRTDVSNVVQVSAGPQNTCVLLEGGDVKCWGARETELNHSKIDAGSVDAPIAEAWPPVYNASGTRVGSDPEIRDMIQIDNSGRFHSCGLRQDGTVWCWGSNVAGKLGDFSDHIVNVLSLFNGAVQNTPTPVQPLPVFQVRDLPGPASSISTGGEFSCAVMEEDSSVHCWGKNYGFGEFGDPGPAPYDIVKETQSICGYINGVPNYCTQTSTINATSPGSSGATQRFNVVPHQLEFFPKDGLNPDRKTVPDVFDVARSSEIISASFTITGLMSETTTAGATIAGDGSPEFRINNGPWVTSEAVANDDVVEMRLTSSADYLTESQATMMIGSTEITFTVKTENTAPPETTTLLSAIISESEFSDMEGSGLLCMTEGLTPGDTINTQDFIDQPYTGQAMVSGNPEVACVGQRSCSMSFGGACYGSWTSRAYYVSW